MIPCCVVCGRSAQHWHDDEWMGLGGLQDFCPQHASIDMQEYSSRMEGPKCE